MTNQLKYVTTTAIATLMAAVLVAITAQAAEKPQVDGGDFAEIVGAAQEAVASSGRVADGTPVLAGAEASVDSSASVAADVEECFHGSREGDLNVWRHAGENRWETSVCVSRAMWGDHDDPDTDVHKAQAVVLARGDRYEDALSSGPLAAWTEAPVLLTRPTSMRAVVRDEIERVLAPGGLIYLVGGPNAISAEIEADLSAEYVTKRIAGVNRYETSVEVAKELPDTNNFFFATGRNFPDALGAGTAAAALTVSARESDEFAPFALLLTRDEVVRPIVADFVRNRIEQVEEAPALVTAGGQAEQAVMAEFGAVTAAFTGSNRYDTAAQVAEGVFTDADTGELVGLGVGLSTGTNFPDALAATPYLAEFAQPLLLARPNDLRQPTTAFLETHAGEGGIPGEDRWIDVFGGPNAIGHSTLDDAVESFN